MTQIFFISIVKALKNSSESLTQLQIEELDDQSISEPTLQLFLTHSLNLKTKTDLTLSS
ncbi:hypothetical protein [Winogradskyella arenosi]|uniref:Uncharacterized protein n=1 Tax=Winogradskyella arenosi TaxID=533325 RepID=A0A368ZIY4_9FLAO|nr:hypothetical protein [Winogradskyella arenosi]RCW92819.1 hypothetical protein DFQ08_102855 [Winogradskyella arenosi]